MNYTIIKDGYWDIYVWVYSDFVINKTKEWLFPVSSVCELAGFFLILILKILFPSPKNDKLPSVIYEQLKKNVSLG